MDQYRPFCRRTLESHHRDCTRITRQAMGTAALGCRTLHLPIPGGAQVSLEVGSAVDKIHPAHGRDLVLYWSIYWALDRLLRERIPIDEPPQENQ
ncbi:MAG: hypothetical protein K2Q20_06645 [Phycisphaerales bacterium]|nr:hypothetical protein [Phycisphaerales bacterium]